jgi:hypothetical protein
MIQVIFCILSIDRQTVWRESPSPPPLPPRARIRLDNGGSALPICLSGKSDAAGRKAAQPRHAAAAKPGAGEEPSDEEKPGDPAQRRATGRRWRPHRRSDQWRRPVARSAPAACWTGVPSYAADESGHRSPSTLEQLLTCALRSDSSQTLKDCFGRGARIGHPAAFRMERSIGGPLPGLKNSPVVAGRVKSPRAASEHFSSQNLDLADWPVWRKLIDRLGSRAPVRRMRKQTFWRISV